MFSVKGISIGKVDVETWKKDEVKNNCPWNIATLQVREKFGYKDGSHDEELLQEIAELTDDIMDLNGIKKGEHVYTGQEIVIPLEYANEEIKSGLDSITKELEESSLEVTKAQDLLSGTTSAVATALGALNKINIPEEKKDKNGNVTNQNDIDKAIQRKELAKEVYIEALQAQKEASENLSKAQEKLTAAQEKATNVGNEFKNTKEELENDKSQEDNDKTNKQLDVLNSNEDEVKNTQDMAEKAKISEALTNDILDTANKNMEAAKKLGLVDENGEIISRENAKNIEIDKNSDAFKEALEDTKGVFFIEDENNNLVQKAIADTSGELKTYNAEIKKVDDNKETPDGEENSANGSEYEISVGEEVNGLVNYETLTGDEAVKREVDLNNDNVFDDKDIEIANSGNFFTVEKTPTKSIFDYGEDDVKDDEGDIDTEGKIDKNEENPEVDNKQDDKDKTETTAKKITTKTETITNPDGSTKTTTSETITNPDGSTTTTTTEIITEPDGTTKTTTTKTTEIPSATGTADEADKADETGDTNKIGDAEDVDETGDKKDVDETAPKDKSGENINVTEQDKQKAEETLNDLEKNFKDYNLSDNEYFKNLKNDINTLSGEELKAKLEELEEFQNKMSTLGDIANKDKENSKYPELDTYFANNDGGESLIEDYLSDIENVKDKDSFNALNEKVDEFLKDSEKILSWYDKDNENYNLGLSAWDKFCIGVDIYGDFLKSYKDAQNKDDVTKALDKINDFKTKAQDTLDKYYGNMKQIYDILKDENSTPLQKLFARNQQSEIYDKILSNEREELGDYLKDLYDGKEVSDEDKNKIDEFLKKYEEEYKKGIELCQKPKGKFTEDASGKLKLEGDEVYDNTKDRYTKSAIDDYYYIFNGTTLDQLDLKDTEKEMLENIENKIIEYYKNPSAPSNITKKEAEFLQRIKNELISIEV